MIFLYYNNYDEPECRHINGLECTNYPQIEIKILRFINAINQQALASHGRIIKILGNHEFESIKPHNYSFFDNYTFKSDNQRINYYRGFNRQKVFNYGNEGFRILFQDGCGLLIKINNTIFAHGQLPDVHHDNNILNNSTPIT